LLGSLNYVRDSIKGTEWAITHALIDEMSHPGCRVLGPKAA